MNPEPRQGEIEAHGIGGIDKAERRGDLQRGARVAAASRGQPKFARQPVHMGVHGHDQLCGTHTAPSAGVDAIRANHPAKEQVQPLEAPAATGQRQQNRNRPLGARVKPCQKVLSRGQRGLGVRCVPTLKGTLQRTKLPQQRPHRREEVGEMVGGKKPIDKAVTPFAKLAGWTGPKRLGGPWSQRTQSRGTGAKNPGNPTERERGGNEPRHFPIRRIVVVEDHLQWIGMEKPWMVVALEQIVEQPGEVRRRLCAGLGLRLHRLPHGSLHGRRFPGMVSTMILQSTILVEFVAQYFYWVFLAILILNMTQRKHQRTAQKKRMATLYLAIAALVIYAGAELCRQYAFGDGVMVAVILAVLAAVFILRDRTFPFTLTCQCTGRRLDWNSILYRDDNCLPEPEPEEDGAEDDPEEAFEESEDDPTP